jgi:hypothetical protein
MAGAKTQSKLAARAVVVSPAVLVFGAGGGRFDLTGPGFCLAGH